MLFDLLREITSFLMTIGAPVPCWDWVVTVGGYCR